MPGNGLARDVAVGVGSSIDESASIGGVFEEGKEGGNGGFLPDEFTERIQLGQIELVLVEKAQSLAA
jgi:hypothetical protein